MVRVPAAESADTAAGWACAAAAELPESEAASVGADAAVRHQRRGARRMRRPSMKEEHAGFKSSAW
jgi:hypothetical protein